MHTVTIYYIIAVGYAIIYYVVAVGYAIIYCVVAVGLCYYILCFSCGFMLLYIVF